MPLPSARNCQTPGGRVALRWSRVQPHTKGANGLRQLFPLKIRQPVATWQAEIFRPELQRMLKRRVGSILGRGFRSFQIQGDGK